MAKAVIPNSSTQTQQASTKVTVLGTLSMRAEGNCWRLNVLQSVWNIQQSRHVKNQVQWAQMVTANHMQCTKKGEGYLRLCHVCWDLSVWYIRQRSRIKNPQVSYTFHAKTSLLQLYEMIFAHCSDHFNQSVLDLAHLQCTAAVIHLQSSPCPAEHAVRKDIKWQHAACFLMPQ